MYNLLLSLQRSSAELLGYALSQLFPQATLVRGGSTTLGFYYDFISPQTLNEQALPLIEEKMRYLVKEEIPIHTMTMMRKNAIEFFLHHKMDLQAEMLEESEDQFVEVCKIHDFCDCAKGPFVEHTKLLSFFKLLNLKHAISELPEENIEVTRVQGVVFPEPQSLKKFLKKYESAKKHDHQLLGQELKLFYQNDDQIVWTLKGEIVRELLRDWWRKELKKSSVQLVSTKENNGLSHGLLVKSSLINDGELPIRIGEMFSTSQELKNIELVGLLSSRESITDLLHTFCLVEQISIELKVILEQMVNLFKYFGLEVVAELATRPKNCVVDFSTWKRSEAWILQAAEACEITTQTSTNESFNGPRIDFMLIDGYGRKWRGPFIGIDCIHPQELKLQKKSLNGSLKPVLMVFYSLFGSLERLFAVLLETKSGSLPFMFAPEQIRVISVMESNVLYAKKILEECRAFGFRTAMDERQEKLGAKIHAAEKDRVPYSVIVGRKEEEKGIVTIRIFAQEAELTSELMPFLRNLH